MFENHQFVCFSYFQSDVRNVSSSHDKLLIRRLYDIYKKVQKLQSQKVLCTSNKYKYVEILNCEKDHYDRIVNVICS